MPIKLPKIEWWNVIPAGTYTIGDENPQYADEGLRPAIISTPYKLSRYPVNCGVRVCCSSQDLDGDAPSPLRFFPKAIGRLRANDGFADATIALDGGILTATNKDGQTMSADVTRSDERVAWIEHNARHLLAGGGETGTGAKSLSEATGIGRQAAKRVIGRLLAEADSADTTPKRSRSHEGRRGSGPKVNQYYYTAARAIVAESADGAAEEIAMINEMRARTGCAYRTARRHISNEVERRAVSD